MARLVFLRGEGVKLTLLKRNHMATLITALNTLMFTSELARLAFKPEGESCVFSISVGGYHRLFENTYYTGGDGTVTVYDVDKILEDDLAGSCYGSYAFYADGARIGPELVTVIRCDARVSEPAESFVTDFFLTAGIGERDTTPGRRETLSFYSPAGEEAAEVHAEYYNFADRAVRSRVFALGSSDPGLMTLDVSPSRFVDEATGLLIGYTVKASKRKVKYRVHRSLPEADPVMIFRNVFGVWETLHLVGTKETSGTYTRESANIAGEYRNYNIEEVVSHKALTGPLRQAMVPVAMDMARSKDVFLLRADGSAGERVTVTACETKHTNEDNAMPNLSFTYRLASTPSSMIETIRPPRIFDQSFDNTYE